MQTLNERKMLKFTKLVNSQLGVQLSAYQEETCETANVDAPVITPTELDLPSEDRTPPNFPCKSTTWETEGKLYRSNCIFNKSRVLHARLQYDEHQEHS